jgi:hypothetical protein
MAVTYVSDEQIDPIPIFSQPGGVQMPNDGGGVDEIAIVEVVVVCSAQPTSFSPVV